MATLLAAGPLLSATLLAQATGNQPASAAAGSGSTPSLAAKPPAPPTPIPPLPAPRSPISYFRDLLAMDPAGRERSLTNRPPEVRKLILAKIQEYASLAPDERELRLRVTELRWYLRPLMSMPATNRPAQLAMIPEEHRELVAARLQEWDKLPAEMQKELLANEATIRYLTEIQGRTDEQRRQALEAVPPASRPLLEKGIDQWSSMTEEQRQRMLNHFRQFFELTAQEKEKLVNTLPAPERGRIEKAMRTFGNLPPDQRDECIRAFEKFASLSPAERQQFLKSAEHWKLMSPNERKAWRELVRTLPPPLPPGVRIRTPGLPPMPPGVPSLPISSHATPPVPVLATNGN